MGRAGIKAATIELHNGRGKSPDIMLTRGHDVTDVSVSALSPVSGPALTLAQSLDSASTQLTWHVVKQERKVDKTKDE